VKHRGFLEKKCWKVVSRTKEQDVLLLLISAILREDIMEYL